MKKQTFGEKLRSAVGIISILIATFTIFEAFIEVESRAIQNKRSINELMTESADLFDRYHTVDVRLSRLETINDLQIRKKLV